MSTPPPPPAPYAGYYGYPAGYPQPQPTNAMAIASLVCALVFAPLGILFGHVSLSQIKRTGEDGRGLAIAGLVIGYQITVLTVVVVLLSVLVVVTVARDLESLDGQTPDYTAAPSPPAVNNALPPFDPPKTLGSNCQYPATTEPASKPVRPPRNGRIATDPRRCDADHQPRRHRTGNGQRQGAVHGQQLHEPGAAGVLRQTPNATG